ncbi:dihydroorotate dehydrogenase B (NAD(+)), electron transfer subunit [Clostridia bacterium]|nr:dihydroorotate dehydrogenase B (NAD(+)), electron transfer subunit [Clostridia bacterium]
MEKCYLKILEKEEIRENIFSVWVEGVKNAKAGQFLHILPKNKTLRRPISICEIDGEKVRIVFSVRGDGTAEIATYDDTLDIVGPCGNGFTFQDAEKVLLVGGGIGVPPLLEIAKHYRKSADVVLGFRNSDLVILEEDFKKTGASVNVQTNYIIDLPEKDYDVVYTVGPFPMMKAVAQKYKNVFVSLEERMGCGVGACLCCPVRTTDGMKRVCKDGPVFNSNDFLW